MVVDAQEADDMTDRDGAHRPAADLAEARAWLDALEQLSTAEEREGKRLRDRLELFRQFVENSQGLVCSHDLTGKLLYVSPAPRRHPGHSRAPWRRRDSRRGACR